VCVCYGVCMYVCVMCVCVCDMCVMCVSEVQSKGNYNGKGTYQYDQYV